MNPKFLGRATYLLFVGFATFHITKLTIALLTSFILSRFGKPQLIRETSKIYNSNIFAVPYMQMKKFMQFKLKRTEKDLLEGVILEKNLED